jgi:hypothetical protein
MSPLLDSPLTESRHKTRTDTTRTPGALSGTDGSNPAPSTGESANFQSLSAGRDTFGPGSAEQAAVLVRATAKSVSWHRYRSQAAEALIFSLRQPAGRYGGDRHAAAYRPFRWEPLTCR